MYRKTLLYMCVLCCVIFPLLVYTHRHGHKLKQVIVLSRHNLRTPITAYLELYTQKNWHKFKEETGHLTSKGHLLERAMGKWFSDWMIEQGLFENNCSKDQYFVYANNQQRTIGTANAFIEGAFGDCAETYYNNMTEWDPVFNSVMRNTSKEFKDTVLNEMKMKMDNLDLKEAYLDLNRIVDFRHSQYCKIKNTCDLNEAKTDVRVEVNLPCFFNMPEALKISTILVDAFLMEYYDYDSKLLKNETWGEINTTEQWKILTKVIEAYQDLCFKTKFLDKDVASTFLEYLTDIFEDGTRKFYLLVGHDTNIVSLLSSLRFKEYYLHGQFEKTPIGGKVVFEKWYDELTGRELLRVRYVYQSFAQIRDGAEASLLNPPLSALLEMENCAADINGYCPWNDFINILTNV